MESGCTYPGTYINWLCARVHFFYEKGCVDNMALKVWDINNLNKIKNQVISENYKQQIVFLYFRIFAIHVYKFSPNIFKWSKRVF